MDIVGVAGIAAEAELLSAVATLLRRLGLGPDVVAIRVSSRKVLHALLEAASVPAASFAPACVILDKSEKLPRGDVVAELASLGIPETAADSLLSGMALRSVGELEGLLGEGHGAVADMRLLWRTAEAAGFAPYLEFDASVVRGLAYYTGLVFEVNDRAGALRCVRCMHPFFFPFKF